MKTKTAILLFLFLAVIQLTVPLYMTWHWEDVLKNGHQFYWATAPVDPYDALKGRYIDLHFKEMSGPILDGSDFAHGQTAYAVIGERRDNKAYIQGIRANRPAGEPFLRVKVLYVKKDQDQAFVIVPFKRYYLPEDVAPAAETAYRTSAGKDGVALVRIKDGYGVVEQLYIGDKTLLDVLRERK
ncbi:MAG TPA: GDYXXLXY domain-containing protein [Methylomusa anaerophila]|nr:GDYXXLXY domain-containing protein [Methylomusa anaerophila]HML88225.1 GDYXXLXY domain-containing protein [Methylomusa anaerophila]